MRQTVPATHGDTAINLSALVVAHNEEDRIAACLEHLTFADEIVVVLDRCHDRTEEIAEAMGARTLSGAWPIEGDRRNTGIKACRGTWIVEVDCDEQISDTLGREIVETIRHSRFDWHGLRVDNYVGNRLVRHGWGGSFGTSAVSRLFRKGAKVWGRQSVHPEVILHARNGGGVNVWFIRSSITLTATSRT